MPLFAYRARNDDGLLVRGKVESDNRSAVESSLAASGLIPIEINETRQGFDLERLQTLFETVKPDDVIVLTRQLGTMYRAGIPFVRSIKGVCDQTDNKALKKIMETVREDVEEGSTFAKALSRHPKVFDELYVSMVEAGEAGGVLDEIFNRLSILLEKEGEIKEKIKSATLYPKIVVGAIVVAVFILISFVIPKFAQLYSKFGAELPLPTRLLIAISGFFSSYWYIGLIMIIFIIFVFRRFIKSEKGRISWDGLRLKFPIFGSLSHKASISRFTRILGTLTGSGLPILMALEISGRALGNVVLSGAVDSVREQIRRGASLAAPMEESRFFPSMVTQMVAVGEETGQLDDMLINVADHLDGEVDYTIRNLQTLLEPILLFIMFGMVLFLALSLFLPMWDLVKLTK